MYPHWTELRSLGQERLQQRIAEANERRPARRVAPALPAGPSLWQALAGTLRRVAALRVRPAAPTAAEARLSPTQA